MPARNEGGRRPGPEVHKYRGRGSRCPRRRSHHQPKGLGQARLADGIRRVAGDDDNGGITGEEGDKGVLADN